MELMASNITGLSSNSIDTYYIELAYLEGGKKALDFTHTLLTDYGAS